MEVERKVIKEDLEVLKNYLGVLNEDSEKLNGVLREQILKMATIVRECEEELK
jgi:hypothetical protein